MSETATGRNVRWLRRPRVLAAVAAALLVSPVLTFVVAEADIGPFDESCDKRAAEQLEILRLVLEKHLPAKQAGHVWYENFCEYSDGGAAIWSVGTSAEDDVERLVRAGWAEVAGSDPDMPFSVARTDDDGHTVLIRLGCEDGACEATATADQPA